MESEVGLTARNPRIKRLRQLVNQARTRRDDAVIVVEGPTLVAEAVRQGHEPLAIFADVGLDLPPELAGQTVTRTVPGVLGSVLSSRTPQPVAAIVGRPTWDLADLDLDRSVLVLVGVSDPGNLGSLWRSAEAAGCAGLVVCGSSVDPTNPKVVRAAAGAALRCPLVLLPSADSAVAAMREQGRAVLATSVSAMGRPHDGTDLRSAAILVGNEAHGLAPEVMALADAAVHIELDGPTESLGVAAAGAVLVFESRRQRRSLERDNHAGDSRRREIQWPRPIPMGDHPPSEKGSGTGE